MVFHILQEPFPALKVIPNDWIDNKENIDLFVFTDGVIQDNQIELSEQINILFKKNVNIYINTIEPNNENYLKSDCSAGNETTLAISGGNIFGTGEAGAYQLGNNSTTDLLVFTLVSGSGIWSQSFAFGNFSKATTTSSFHYHAGAKAYVTGDGSTSGQFLTWTRVGTDNGWSYFAGEKLSTSTQYGTIGIRSGSLFYIGQNGSGDAWKPNSTFTGYISGSNDATWLPILTSSRRCTAAYVGGSITNATLIMSLQPL